VLGRAVTGEPVTQLGGREGGGALPLSCLHRLLPTHETLLLEEEAEEA
jgi:hypothetical protein